MNKACWCPGDLVLWDGYLITFFLYDVRPSYADVLNWELDDGFDCNLCYPSDIDGNETRLA